MADAEREQDAATGADLLAEIERLRRWKAEATEVILGLQDLGKALGLPLGTSITGPAAVDAAKALQARLRAVEALADEAESGQGIVITPGFSTHYAVDVKRLRAALAPATSPAEQEGDRG